MSEEIKVELENGDIVKWGDLKELSFEEQLDFIGIEAIPSVVNEIKDVANMILKLKERQSEYGTKLKSFSKSIENKMVSDGMVKSCLLNGESGLRDYVKSMTERLYY